MHVAATDNPFLEASESVVRATDPKVYAISDGVISLSLRHVPGRR
jgi:hypothetical protein